MEAPFDADKTKDNLLNFSGSASDMMSAMATAGIVVPDAQDAALKVASAPPSAPEACTDPTCTADHDHAGHDHGHHHGHEHGHGHGHGHGHEHKKEDNAHGHGHGGGGGHGKHDHGHSHEHYTHPGHFKDRETAVHSVRPLSSFEDRGFTVGIGGPVGSGKTATLLKLCQAMREGPVSIAAVTNDIFTREDGEFLTRHEALEPSRIRAVETGGCPHAAIREDVSANLKACEELTALHDAKIVFVESGGDNLAANFSRELADYTIYVIDVAGGDKVPRKGGPGITQSDLLVINKTDLADAVGSDLKVMERDAKKMRGEGPTLFTQVKHGVGVPEIVKHITDAYRTATTAKAKEGSGHDHGHGHGHGHGHDEGHDSKTKEGAASSSGTGHSHDHGHEHKHDAKKPRKH